MIVKLQSELQRSELESMDPECIIIYCTAQFYIIENNEEKQKLSGNKNKMDRMNS